MSIDSDYGQAETLSKALGFTETVIELGPPHPAMRRVLAASGGTVGFLVSLDDERITELEVEIGMGHRGFEKEVESVPWHRALPYVGRLGYAGGLMAEVGYCLGVEALAGVEVPDRAIWLRMLASEIARVSDHFARLAAVSSAIGVPAGEAAALQGQVEASRLLEAITGRPALGGWVRLGGVKRAPLEDFKERFDQSRATLNRLLIGFEAMVINNPSCQMRLREVASFSAEECVAWSVTGPALRAAGTPGDVRREAPYLAYGAVDFDVPIGENGDNLDRMLIVVEEIRQSIHIAEQCESLLGSLGPGAVSLSEPGWGAPLETDLSDRSARVLEGPRIPAGEVAVSIESSTGELGFLLVSDGEVLPRRIRCRSASFLHAQALQSMLLGERLDDLLPTAALMHLVSGECDR